MQNHRLGTGLCAAAVMACAGAAAVAEPTLVSPSTVVQDAISASVNVSDFTLQKTDVQGELGAEIALELNIEGVVHTFVMQPYTIRSETFRVITIGADGVRREQPAPQARTYRGFSTDGEMSISGSLFDAGFGGQVIREGDIASSWDVQPLSMAAPVIDEGTYLVYDTSATLPSGYTCGGAVVADDLGFVQPDVNASAGPRASFLELEMIMDCDWHFYNNDNGANLAATIADTENIMGGVSTAYERDLNITVVLNEIIVRTSLGANPYTTNDAGGLLDQVRSEWIGTGGTNPRDLLHMFTGRNINGGTIGVAWLGATCSTNIGYGLSESRFTGNFNSRVALTAHEVGHNLNAPHCSGGSCYIMCAGLGGCGGISPPGVTGSGFGNSSINIITNYANTRPCLDKAGPPFLEIPVFDDFASTTIDTDRWQEINGAVVNSNASNEPSSPNSLNLDGGDSIITGRMDLAPFVGGDPIFVTLYTQHIGVENGESLVLEYEDILGFWQVMNTWVSDGANQSDFEYAAVVVPLLAFHNEVRFRLRSVTNSSTDDWYVDDFSIDFYQGLLPPFLDDYESGLDTTLTYESVSGATISTAADNEISGINSLNLDNADSVTTYNIRMQSEFGTPHWVRIYTQHKGVENGETLTVEWFDILSVWQPLGTITSDGSVQTEFVLNQFVVPDLGFHNNFALRVSANGNNANDDWYVDDLAVSPTFIDPPMGGCNAADLAAPFGTLDFSDVVAFLGAFGAMDPAADLAAPFGTWDFSDVVTFLGAFGAGCP